MSEHPPGSAERTPRPSPESGAVSSFPRPVIVEGNSSSEAKGRLNKLRGEHAAPKAEHLPAAHSGHGDSASEYASIGAKKGWFLLKFGFIGIFWSTLTEAVSRGIAGGGGGGGGGKKKDSGGGHGGGHH